jgi:NAD(P)-dependent dehydrogenase (short-subunit alcohol dehydrogenase family)
MQDSVGRIDILLTVPPSSRDVSPQALPCIEKLRSEIEINVLKNASIVNTFLPLLKAAKQSCVVMISSAAASLGDRVIAKRSTDKATCVALTALNALAKTYAEQLEPYGIKVNVIAPDAGVMSTDVTAGESILEEVSRLILQTGTHILGSPTGCFLSVNGTVSW